MKPAERQSIAVLPFANLSADKEDVYFSNGFAEEILDMLARVPDLKVTARTSAFGLVEKDHDHREIAEALQVSGVVRGTVRRSDGRIWVRAELIKDGHGLWSKGYEREISEIFAIQKDIASAIVEVLQLKVVAGALCTHHYMPNLSAYEAFLRGRHYLALQTADTLRRVKECLETAISLDPEYPDPYVELGVQYVVLWALSLRPAKDVVPLLGATARKALSLDPSQSRARALLGLSAAAYDYNWVEARQQFLVAMTTTPIAPEIRWWYANSYLVPLGRFREAVQQMEKVVEEDPLNVVRRSQLAASLNLAEIYDRAIDEAQKAVEINEHHWLAHETLSWIYASTGTMPEAIAASEKAYQLTPWNARVIGVLAGTLARSGNRARADELLLQLKSAPSASWGMVAYHLLCSESDAVIDCFEQAIEAREAWAVVFASAPITMPFRQSPRWPSLMRKMNLLAKP